ncbi:hypothetical protein [Arthrobacter sp. TMN-50]
MSRSIWEHSQTVVVGEVACAVPADWVLRLAAAGHDVIPAEVPGEPHVMMYGSPEATARHCLGETSHAAR